MVATIHIMFLVLYLLKMKSGTEVGKWMWANRDFYNGLSVLPYFGGSHKQMPFEDTDEKTFNTLFNNLREVDLSGVIEVIDNTNLTGELACAGLMPVRLT